MAGLRGITSIASRGSTAYARRFDGTVWAWGFGQFGELGNGTGDGQTLSLSRVPVRVRNLTHVTAIAAGGATGYALRADHTVWAWGDGALGELGSGLNTLSNVPVRVPRLGPVCSIAASSQTAYVVTGHRTVWAWGYGIDGQLGNGQTPFASTVPVKVRTLTGVVSISAGGDTAYARN